MTLVNSGGHIARCAAVADGMHGKSERFQFSRQFVVNSARRRIGQSSYIAYFVLIAIEGVAVSKP